MKKLNYTQTLLRLTVYCSHSERCIWDVCQKMETWEVPFDQRNQIIQYLQKEKFIDEERYCRAFVNDKAKYNRWGNIKIKYELCKKQIPEPLIREALKNLNPAETLERLRTLLEQKKKSVKGKNEWEIRQKLLRFAASKGFSQEEFEEAMGDE